MLILLYKVYNFIKKYLKLYKKEVYLSLVGCFWIIFYIYIRFVVERNPYDLHNLTLNVSFMYIIVQISLIILHICLIVSCVNIIRNNTMFSTNNSWIISKINILSHILIAEPLEYLREKIGPHIPGSGILFTKAMDNIIFYNIDPSKIAVICFYVIPRVIVALVFFIEHTVTQQIYYFIPSLMLLLIPLLWTMFINFFTDFGKRLLDQIPQVVEVIPLGDPLENGWYKEYAFKEKPEFSYEENDLQEYADTWHIGMKIYNYGENYLKTFQSKIAPYVTLICSVLYCAAIVFKVLFLLGIIL